MTRTRTNKHLQVWRAARAWCALGVAGTMFLGTQPGRAADTPVTAGIAVREISIRRAEDDAPVSAVVANRNYRVRILIRNVSRSSDGFHYIETKTVVFPGVGGALFFEDDTYNRQIPYFISDTFTFAPGQARELWIPTRFSTAGNARDKQFRLTVTGAEIPIKSGSVQVNAL